MPRPAPLRPAAAALLLALPLAAGAAAPDPAAATTAARSLDPRLFTLPPAGPAAPPPAEAPPPGAPPDSANPAGWLPPPAAWAAPPPPRRSEAPGPREHALAASAQVGASFGGTLTTAAGGTTERRSVDPGVTALARVDVAVIPRLTMGLYGQLMQARLPQARQDLGVYGFGLSLVGRVLGEARGPQVRLGALAGYQANQLSAASAGGSNGLGLGAVVEGAWPVHPTTALLAHAGVLTQARGGNRTTDVTFGPIFTVAVGAEYGR